jgi:hypothetical protein
MKKLYTLLMFIITLTISAQAPQGFNYQATVRNSSGALITNQNVYFKFNVMLNSATSAPVYSETHYVPTDDLGAVNLVIGQGTSATETFSAINWGSGNYYLGIELNTGNGYAAMGTTQLLSVPFALYANNSSSLQYPDGISNDTRIINSSTSFTVPSGKNFIINYAQKGIKIDNITFDNSYPPIMIAGSGQTISTIHVDGFISGFLTNAGVIAITNDLTIGNYIVPAGKLFVLLFTNDQYNQSLLINNNNPNPNVESSFPSERQLLLGAGTIISCNCSINGYLK